MAILKIDPGAFDTANSVLVDSDAATNEQALREIDQWAASHGFARTTEYWLRVILRDGKRLYRGTCYRLTDEERAAADQYLRDVQDRAQRLAPPRTA